MKKIFFIVLLILPYILISSPGYEILKGHNLSVSKIRDYNKKEIAQFIELFDSIYKMDQCCRKQLNVKDSKQVYANFIKYGMKVDSITFNKYKSFFEQRGYFSFNKTILSKWIPSITDFLLRHNAMQLHFSDNWAFDLMRLIENSINLKSCNEEDLMDYFVTYLFRKTEFKTYEFCEKGFHVVLLPNLESGAFHQYYKYAYCKYMLYCKSRFDDFAYIRVSNVLINDKKKFDWSKAYVKYPENTFLSNRIMEIVHKYNSLVELIIKNSNPYKFEDGTYSVLICNHPNLGTNPNYDF